MGHERVGALPRTKRWRTIVNTIANLSSNSPSDVSLLADQTLQNVSSQFQKIYADKGVQAAFGYLVFLATQSLPQSSGVSSPPATISDEQSPVRIVQQLNEWVSQHAESREYSEIATRAVADTIAEWTRNQSKQHLLFEEDISARSVWNQTANGSGFCEVARLFFSHFTERYLRYFLEREASAQIANIRDRQHFNQNLHRHIDDVSRHAFETSKITQSFAAGWFNKHAQTTRPSDREIKGFLAIAFGKLHEELKREAGR